MRRNIVWLGAWKMSYFLYQLDLWLKGEWIGSFCNFLPQQIRQVSTKLIFSQYGNIKLRRRETVVTVLAGTVNPSW